MNQIGPLLTRHVKKTGPATESEGVILPEKLLGVFDECPRELVEAGFDWRVLQEHDVGYDKRLNRITFPIRTMTGELAGIVGRCRDPDFGGKYKVYTTELRTFGFNIETFKKSNFLWRGDKVLSVLSESTGRPDIFVVEGFKAALWFAQSGIDTVVALMGSSMSNRQQQHIERFGGRVILCLDNDPAGKKATRKISHQLRAVRTLVVPLPEGIHQPDDLTGEELVEFCSSPTSLREAINQWTE
jgi:DNA primase